MVLQITGWKCHKNVVLYIYIIYMGPKIYIIYMGLKIYMGPSMDVQD